MAQILPLSGADAARVRVKLYDSVTSTLDLAREAAERGEPEGTVIAAREQTAGRGRQGRSFFSPRGTGLYLSMILRPVMPAEDLTALTPMAAVAAAEAIEQLSGRKAEIKWVNDILLDGKKVCGILVESKFSAARPEYALLGIGINLLEPSGGFPEAIRQTAAAVFPQWTDGEPAFRQMAAALVSALLRQYDGLAEKRYLAPYRERLCVLGREITVCENGTESPATALAVDDSLRLLVRYADGTEQWRATGEIRIRL